MPRSVCEFVIMAPEPVHKALVQSRERLRAYLQQQFPAYVFSLVEMIDAADEPDGSFMVVPIMGTVGSDDAPGEMHDLELGVVDQIATALSSFQLHRSQLN